MRLRCLLAAIFLAAALSPPPAIARPRLERAIQNMLKPPTTSARPRGRGAKSSFPAEPRSCAKRDRLVYTPQGFVRRKVDVCS